MRPAPPALPLAVLLLVATVSGCAKVPFRDRDGNTAAQQADWPLLLPMAQILTNTDTATTDPTLAVQARAARLRARAAALSAAEF